MRTFLLGIAGLALSAGAAPVVKESSVTMTQDAASHLVTINYELKNEPAIITVDIQTNGVSIGGRNLWGMTGDVNKRVDVGTHSLTWHPDGTCKIPAHLLPGSMTAVVTAWATNTPPLYLATSLSVTNSTFFYADKDSVPGGIESYVYKTDVLLMRKIPAAKVEWRMGSGLSEGQSGSPAHLVTLQKDFYIGVYPVTQRQYELIMGKNPSAFCRADCYSARPVENVTYEGLRGKTGASWPANEHTVAAGSFFDSIRKWTGITHLDLPMEARWEFACRAGCGEELYGELDKIARYSDNGGSIGTAQPSTVGPEHGTAIVGSYLPNAYDLYDMMGNVWEICLDWYATGDTLVNADPEKGPTSGSNRVWRGSSWTNVGSLFAKVFRHNDAPSATGRYLGFRIACEVSF